MSNENLVHNEIEIIAVFTTFICKILNKKVALDSCSSVLSTEITFTLEKTSWASGATSRAISCL